MNEKETSLLKKVTEVVAMLVSPCDLPLGVELLAMKDDLDQPEATAATINADQSATDEATAPKATVTANVTVDQSTVEVATEVAQPTVATPAAQ